MVSRQADLRAGFPVTHTTNDVAADRQRRERFSFAVKACNYSYFGKEPAYVPATALSIVAMSIFFIVNIACMARLARSGSLSVT